MLTIVKKNDSYDAITYQLENEDNSTVDLTGASVNFVMGKKNKLITNAKATVTSATSGIVSYQLTPSDTLVSGTFLAEFVVTFANGTTKTYPSNGYITVDVEQNLNTSQNNVVLDMIATKQGDFEAKLDSILKQGTGTQVSAMNEYTWTATSGQTIFVFPTNAKYDPSAKWFQVSVGNVPIANDLINRASSSQFSLVVDPSLIVAGMTVHAMWVEPIVPITGGHHSTHEINGQDEINIANLRNYQELVATPIASNTTALAEKATKTVVYPEDYGAKGDGVTDDTVAIQSAIDAAHGTVGKVMFKPATYLVMGTLFIQKDTLSNWSLNSKVNNPISLIGSNDTKLFAEGTQSTKGSTVLYKPNAGDLMRVNLDSNGYKVIQQPGLIFKNFKMENICLKGVQGIQTTGMKIFSTRIKLENVSFISLYRGIDANDAEAGGEQNYCDLWHLSDITLTGTGDWGIRVANDDAGIFERITMEAHQSTIQGGLYFSWGRGITLSGLLINSLPSTAMAAIYLSAAHNVNINGSHFEYIQSIGIDIESGGEVTIQNCEFFNPSTKSGSAYPQATNHMIKGIGNGIVVSGNTFSLDRASGYDVYLSGVRNQEKNNTYITSAHNYSAERTASFYVINSKGTSFSQPLFIEVKYDTTSSTIKIYSPEGTDITSQFPNVTWNGNGVDFQNCVPINRAMLAVPVQLYNKYRPVLRNTLGLLVYSLNTSNTLVTTPDANIDFMLYLS